MLFDSGGCSGQMPVFGTVRLYPAPDTASMAALDLRRLPKHSDIIAAHYQYSAVWGLTLYPLRCFCNTLVQSYQHAEDI
jgi:hypothetical protein